MATAVSRAVLAATVSGIALAVASTEMQAQEGEGTLLGRIVFGAGEQKVAVDTPQAVTVITQEDIDEQAAETVGSLLEGVPGANATGNPDNIIGQNFNIRGFGPQEIGSNQEGRVVVNVDGATKYYESYRMGGFFGDSELYKSVEVLRGPASGTLYGTSVLGGVINFTTKDASDFLEDGENAAVRLKVLGDSNQEGFRTSKIVATRFGENVELLGAFNYTHFDDLVSGDGEEQPGTGNEFPSGLAKLTLRFGENNEQVIRAKYERTEVDGFSAVATGGIPVFVRDAVTRQLTDETQVIPRRASDTSALLSYENPASDNPWLDLNITLSYSELRNEQLEFINADFSYTYTELKVDNTFEWITDNFENYLTIGLAAKYQERRRRDLDGTPVGSHPEGDETTFGAYVQNEFIWRDKLTVIGGLRVDWREIEPIGTTYTYTTTGRGATADDVADRPVIPDDVSDVAFAPKVAAIYEVFNGFNVFGSLAYTERMAGIDEELSFDYGLIRAGDAALFPQSNLDKERAYSVEGGISQTIDGIVFDDDAFAYKVTGFYNRIEDLIIRDSQSSRTAPLPEYVNEGEAEIYGVEFEASYNSEYVFASAYGSVIRGENTDNDRPLSSIAPDEVGFTIGGKVPHYDVRFGFDTRIVASQGRTLPAVGGFRDPSVSFHVHDIWASWRPDEGPLDGLSVTARLDNIGDEFYEEFLSTAGPAKGRTFRGSLAYTLKF
ncbi:MAG: TonB-dependent receptor [Pseudomonadota bacterium]